MRTYYKNHIWDMVICLIMSVSLSYVAFAGYEINDPKARSLVWIGLICAVSVLVVFTAGYNRRTVIIGIGIGLAAAVAVLILVRGFHSTGGRIDKNPALFWMITIGVSALCYILTRWRLTIVILMVGGAIMSAAFGFLKYPINMWAYLLFMAAVIIMFLYRVYDISLLGSYTGSVRYGRYTAQAAAFTLVIALAAGGIFAGIIVPLKPPVHPLKLITKLESLQVLQKVGVSRETEVPDQQKQTQQKNDQNENTDQKQDQDQNTKAQNEKDENQQGDLQQQTRKEKTRAVNYHQSHVWVYVLIAVLTALACASPFVVRHMLNKRWENKVQAADPADGAVMIYDWLMRKMKYAGFTRPEGVTLLRYMRGQKRAMKDFAVGSVSMLTLTRMYQEVIYGCRELSPEEFRRFWRVYKAFRSNLKERLGKFKYALRFFFI